MWPDKRPIRHVYDPDKNEDHQHSYNASLYVVHCVIMRQFKQGDIDESNTDDDPSSDCVCLPDSGEIMHS